MNDIHPSLFEVNLLGDRISVLRRREVFHRVVGVAALGLLVLGGFFASLAVANISAANRFKNGIRSLSGQLVEEEKDCAEIDKLRAQAGDEVQSLRALLPLAANRISWAPKLKALKETLQPSTGIQSVYATSGKPPQKAAPPERSSKNKNTKKPATPPPPPPVNPDDLPSFSVSFLYLPISGNEADPIAPVDALRANSAFMQGLSDFRMEASEEGYWKGQPVIILRAKAQGGLR